MKIAREKKIRAEYGRDGTSQIVEQMIRSVEEYVPQRKKKRSYRNVCQITGRARGVMRQYNISRHEYRKAGDRGQLEGVRRASW